MHACGSKLFDFSTEIPLTPNIKLQTLNYNARIELGSQKMTVIVETGRDWHGFNVSLANPVTINMILYSILQYPHHAKKIYATHQFAKPWNLPQEVLESVAKQPTRL